MSRICEHGRDTQMCGRCIEARNRYRNIFINMIQECAEAKLTVEDLEREIMRLHDNLFELKTKIEAAKAYRAELLKGGGGRGGQQLPIEGRT